MFYEKAGTQWDIVAGFGGAVKQGIRYRDLEAISRFYGIPIDGDLFELIQVFEDAALDWDKRRPKAPSPPKTIGEVEGIERG